MEFVRSHLTGLLLALALLVSVTFFLVSPPERVRRTLFFPGAALSTLSGEQRYLPRIPSQQRSIAILAEDLILGPTLLKHSRALPRRTVVRSVMLDGNTVYLDLSADAIGDDEIRFDTRIGLDALERTVRHNFRRLDTVVVTISGQIPYQPAFRPAAAGR